MALCTILTSATCSKQTHCFTTGILAKPQHGAHQFTSPSDSNQEDHTEACSSSVDVVSAKSGRARAPAALLALMTLSQPGGTSVNDWLKSEK
eukprot:1149954-Pelagomonas_calceolata.AAC.2